MKRMVTPLAALALALMVGVRFTGATAGAQGEITVRSRVAGSVLDPSGAVLPGVTVTLTASDRTTREAVTDRDGRFLFDDVKPATGYTLKAELGGFIPDEAHDLVVRDRQTVTVDLAMDIGCVGDLVVPLSDLDLLLRAKGLAHVRMTGDTVDRRDGCGPKRTAVVLGMTLFSPIGPDPATESC